MTATHSLTQLLFNHILDDFDIIVAFDPARKHCVAIHDDMYIKRICTEYVGTFPPLDRRLNQSFPRLIRSLESKRRSSGVSFESNDA